MSRIVLWGLFGVCAAGHPVALADEPTDSEQPSAEMLEFLAEFPGMDDGNFELLVEHGLRDLDEDEENRDDDE